MKKIGLILILSLILFSCSDKNLGFSDMAGCFVYTYPSFIPKLTSSNEICLTTNGIVCYSAYKTDGLGIWTLNDNLLLFDLDKNPLTKMCTDGSEYRYTRLLESGIDMEGIHAALVVNKNTLIFKGKVYKRKKHINPDVYINKIAMDWQVQWIKDSILNVHN